MKRSRLVVFDLYPYLKSNKYARPNLKIHGVPVGGITQLLSEIYYEVTCNRADVVVCTEGGGNFRRVISDDYKSNRELKDNHCSVQADYLKEMLPALGIPVLSERSLEADDMIYGVVENFSGNYRYVNIMTCDRDLAHNVTENVTLLPANSSGIIVNAESYTVKLSLPDVIVRYNTITLFKVLFGDKSDNMPAMKFSRKGITPYVVYDAYTKYLVANKVLPENPLDTEVSKRTKLARKREWFEKWMLSRKVLTEYEEKEFLSRLDIFYPKLPTSQLGVGYEENINKRKLDNFMCTLGLTDLVKRYGRFIRYDDYSFDSKFKEYSKLLQSNKYNAISETEFFSAPKPEKKMREFE